jgi:carboxymethylenebutenolidase
MSMADSLREDTYRLDEPDGPLAGLIVWPDAAAARPAVLVVHENKGLQPYVREVARNLAGHGYVAVAPDLLARAGGTGGFGTEESAVEALRALDQDVLAADLKATVSHVRGLPGVDPQRIGAIGFCFGGGMVWNLITLDPDVRAAVPFYGRHPSLSAVPQIQAPVLAIYGELDERINDGIGVIEAAMAENGKTFSKIIYPGAQHAFHNHLNPRRYHPEAAAAAWTECLSWLDKYLDLTAG